MECSRPSGILALLETSGRDGGAPRGHVLGPGQVALKSCGKQPRAPAWPSQHSQVPLPLGHGAAEAAQPRGARPWRSLGRAQRSRDLDLLQGGRCPASVLVPPAPWDTEQSTQQALRHVVGALAPPTRCCPAQASRASVFDDSAPLDACMMQSPRVCVPSLLALSSHCTTERGVTSAQRPRPACDSAFPGLSAAS